MRILLAAAAILALAGCNRDGGNAQNSAGLPTPPPRPGINASTDLGSDQAFRQSYRTLNIATCINSTRAQAAQGGNIAPGTDFRPACTCYIDRAMAGLSVEQLANMRPGPREERIIEQCVREHGLVRGLSPTPDSDAGEEPVGDGSGGK